jgi:hypothetical protein
MFERSFPAFLIEDVKKVTGYISSKVPEGSRMGVSEQYIKMLLLNGDEVQFPQRIYFEDAPTQALSTFTKEQRCMYHCIYTRHHDGYIREKHVMILLLEYPDELPDWVCPFLLSISGEYVMEILEQLYEQLYLRRNQTIQAICLMNRQQFLYIHDRMISYWNEFYRSRCPRYKQYIGKKLFEDCYGYTRSMEKTRHVLKAE